VTAPIEEHFADGLYVVATPIGNLGDLSPRAAAVLRAAAVVAAEDTRTAAVVLRRAGSNARRVSLTEHNVEQRIPALIEAARAGVAALVSDAGTPAVSDPGARLVAAAHGAGVRVVAVPGPSALTAALSVAGFDLQVVVFLGFLPRKAAARRAALVAAASTAPVIVFFESPGRLASTLREAAEALGDPETAVCRELTKVHEEVVRGRASELAIRFEGARGECTVVLHVERPRGEAGESKVREFMAAMQHAGARRAAAASEAARLFGVAREDAYGMWEEG
jgi:16S rRNA (cytidine1402-2'-O)-methyltransferase